MADEDLSKLKIQKSVITSKQSKRKKLFYAVLIPAVIAVLVLLFAKGLLVPAVEVQVTTVGTIYPSQGLSLLNASGYVVAQRKAAVASKMTGRLVSISVEEGNIVKKGDLIAKFENEDAKALRAQADANLKASQASLEQAMAELDNAEVNFNRYKELIKEELISKTEYDSAEARYKKAVAGVSAAEAAVKASDAALRNADVSLEYTFIRAPFDAVVLTKNADVGDIITPLGAAANAKAAVVTIADMHSLQVEVDVSESNLVKVKGGQPCEIQLDALPDKRFRGEVHMIVPTADRTKATVLVKIKFLDKDKRILPEMSAKVAFLEQPLTPEDMSSRLAVNASSIIQRNGKHYIFIVKENRALETQITPGEKIGDMVAIRSGANAGDRIVANPPEKLRDNTRIKIAEK